MLEEQPGRPGQSTEMLVEQLQTGLEHRTQIGIALGIVMERLDVSHELAFSYLSRVSQDTNRKLYDLAVEIAETRKLPDSTGHGPAGT